MNMFDYCDVFEDEGNGVLLLKFSGTAHLIEDVVDGDPVYDSGAYWIQGVDGESEEVLMEEISTYDDGVYDIHTYCWMITDWCEEEGLMWNTYDSGGTSCVRVEVKDGLVYPSAS